MSDDRFTQEDLQRLVDKWRSILGIATKGTCELVNKVNDDGRIAEIAPCIRRNTFLMRVQRPELRDEPNPDLDNDCCHELIHFILWTQCPEMREMSKIEAEVHESAVDQLATAFVRLYRGQ